MTTIGPSRRRALTFAATAAAAGMAPSMTRAADEPTWKPADPALAATSGAVPLVLPRTELVYEALFDLAPTLQLGRSPFGERRIVPITEAASKARGCAAR